jgi:hypothetical protein
MIARRFHLYAPTMPLVEPGKSSKGTKLVAVLSTSGTHVSFGIKWVLLWTLRYDKKAEKTMKVYIIHSFTMLIENQSIVVLMSIRT